jgi:hypothetical protein
MLAHQQLQLRGCHLSDLKEKTRHLIGRHSESMDSDWSEHCYLRVSRVREGTSEEFHERLRIGEVAFIVNNVSWPTQFFIDYVATNNQCNF